MRPHDFPLRNELSACHVRVRQHINLIHLIRRSAYHLNAILYVARRLFFSDPFVKTVLPPADAYHDRYWRPLLAGAPRKDSGRYWRPLFAGNNKTKKKECSFHNQHIHQE